MFKDVSILWEAKKAKGFKKDTRQSSSIVHHLACRCSSLKHVDQFDDSVVILKRTNVLHTDGVDRYHNSK